MTTPAHRRLDVLLGTWRTTGELWPTSDADPVPFTAEDRYEWLPGGHFLLHHVDAHMPERGQALEVFRVEGDGYVAESYDSTGGHTVSRVDLDGSTLRISAATERFTGEIAGDRVDGVWELRENDVWRRWMSVSLVR